MLSLQQLIETTLPSVPFLKQPDYLNSQLIFNKSTGGAVDSLGNPTGKETFEVQAHLYQVTTEETATNASQNQQQKVYRGHARQPKFLPLWIVAGAGGRCTIGGRSYGFTLLAVDRTAMPAYSQNFGERIEIVIFAASKSL